MSVKISFFSNFSRIILLDHSKINEKQDSEKQDSEKLDGVNFEDKDDAGEGDKEEDDQYKVPYYVENFKLIVKSILEDDYYKELFIEQDLETVTTFNQLSGEVFSHTLYL